MTHLIGQLDKEGNAVNFVYYLIFNAMLRDSRLQQIDWMVMVDNPIFISLMWAFIVLVLVLSV